MCHRSDVTKNGCCDTEAESADKYSCETCTENNCCIIYEYCVSCCLDPSKVKTYLYNSLCPRFRTRGCRKTKWRLDKMKIFRNWVKKGDEGEGGEVTSHLIKNCLSASQTRGKGSERISFL